MERPTSALARVVPFFYGWWVVLAAAIIILVAGAGPLYVFSTLVDPLEDEFGWSRATIGAGPSIAAVMAGLAVPVAGYLVDRVGVRPLLVAGATLVGGGNLALSQVQTLWQFYISASIIAIGMSVASLQVCQVAIAHWFVNRRGRAVGILGAGEGAAGLMVLVAALLISFFGWRAGLMIMGIGQLTICISLASTVRQRPDEMGLLPDGEPSAAGEVPSRPLLDGLGAEGGDGSVGHEEGLTAGQALHTRSFWLLAMGLILAWIGALAIIVHVIVYLDESAGFTEEGAAVIALGIPLGSLVGRVGFGWLADYLNRRWLLAAAWTLQGLGVLVFAAVHSPWQAVGFLVVFAPGFGGAISVLPTLQADYFGLRAFGTIQGLMWGMSTLAAFVGPIFAGAVYDTMETYRPAFLIMGLACLVAGPAVLMTARPRAWAGGPKEAGGLKA
jgi:OFA family oxalate/formate antiporter-like MFS transporter